MREFSEQELVRRGKVEKIREVCNPYPEKYEITHDLKDARNLEDGTTNVRVAGRIVFMRQGPEEPGLRPVPGSDQAVPQYGPECLFQQQGISELRRFFRRGPELSVPGIPGKPRQLLHAA